MSRYFNLIIFCFYLFIAIFVLLDLRPTHFFLKLIRAFLKAQGRSVSAKNQQAQHPRAQNSSLLQGPKRPASSSRAPCQALLPQRLTSTIAQCKLASSRHRIAHCIPACPPLHARPPSHATKYPSTMQLAHFDGQQHDTPMQSPNELLS